jgi:PEP-CTERM motif
MFTSRFVKVFSIAAWAASIALGSSGAAQATSFLSTSTGQVGTLDIATGTFNPLASGVTFTDLALSSDNNLFGITFDQLFSVDPSTGSSSLIGNLGGFNMNALAFSNANQLYSAGGSGFYTINPTTGAASLITNISGFFSSGDLVFDAVNNHFLATSFTGGSDTLFSIGLDGTATELGSIGFSNVYGLSLENGILLGYTADQQQITIDVATGSGTLNQTVTGVNGEIWGATSSSTVVPEPASVLGLLGVAVLGMGSSLKRKLRGKEVRG